MTQPTCRHVALPVSKIISFHLESRECVEKNCKDLLKVRSRSERGLSTDLLWAVLGDLPVPKGALSRLNETISSLPIPSPKNGSHILPTQGECIKK